MDISREDAVLLFKKWIAEGIPLMAFGEGDGFSVAFSGKAIEANQNRILLVRKGQSEDTRAAQIEIDLSGAGIFRYSDPREAPDNVKRHWGHLITGVIGVHLRTSLWVLQELGGARPLA